MTVYRSEACADYVAAPVGQPDPEPWFYVRHRDSGEWMTNRTFGTWGGDNVRYRVEFRGAVWRHYWTSQPAFEIVEGED